MNPEQRLRKLGFTSQDALYDYEIENFAKQRKIRYWRGVYDRQKLPKKPLRKEAIIINLDDYENPGTHWVAIRKYDTNWAIYYDSYGDLPPPAEVVKYLSDCWAHF